MKRNEFYYIKEVAKQNSFSKAAKELGISQPALSNYIKKIEESVGVLLFDRSISPIEITEFGKIYLAYARYILPNSVISIGEILLSNNSTPTDSSIFLI